ncbi:PHP domain-containing protein [bacterium]|nr:PHP domain-containing protein [bacterium]
MVTSSDFSFYESVGAVHLHSLHSDGALAIPEIAEIAGTKGLDFLMFSDHNTLEPKRHGLEGWYGRILVLIGYEINDEDDKNHYLAFRLNEEVPGRKAVEYVAQVKGAGGIGIIAHPAEKRNYFEAYPPYPWTAWDAEGYDGIEIWNQLSEWMEGLTWRNALWRIWHPLRSIRFPVPEIMQRWDRLNRERRVIGVGGIDVHAFTIKLMGFIPVKIYPYKVQFKSIRTHVFTPEEPGADAGFHQSEAALYQGLVSGHCFVSNYSLGDARGFRFYGEINDEIVVMGSRRVFDGTLSLTVTAPQQGHICLLRDGTVIEEAVGQSLQCKVNMPGVYRVEICRKGRGWIYSNPIVLTGVL